MKFPGPHWAPFSHPAGPAPPPPGRTAPLSRRHGNSRALLNRQGFGSSPFLRLSGKDCWLDSLVCSFQQPKKARPGSQGEGFPRTQLAGWKKQRGRGGGESGRRGHSAAQKSYSNSSRGGGPSTHPLLLRLSSHLACFEGGEAPKAPAGSGVSAPPDWLRPKGGGALLVHFS